MQENLDQLQMFHTNHLEGKKLICLQEDFRVRLLALLEKEKGLMTQEVHYFLKSKGFLKITLEMKNPYPVYYSKMLKVYLTPPITEHLLQSMEFCPTSIIPLNANLLILNGGYPKTGNGSISLADIMETQVEEKYFLSTKMEEKLKILNN